MIIMAAFRKKFYTLLLLYNKILYVYDRNENNTIYKINQGKSKIEIHSYWFSITSSPP